MKEKFNTRDEGEVKNWLGAQVDMDPETGGIVLSQANYLRENREKFDKFWVYRKTLTPWPYDRGQTLRCDVPQTIEEKKRSKSGTIPSADRDTHVGGRTDEAGNKKNSTDAINKISKRLD